MFEFKKWSTNINRIRTHINQQNNRRVIRNHMTWFITVYTKYGFSPNSNCIVYSRHQPIRICNNLQWCSESKYMLKVFRGFCFASGLYYHATLSFSKMPVLFYIVNDITTRHVARWHRLCGTRSVTKIYKTSDWSNSSCILNTQTRGRITPLHWHINNITVKRINL